MLAPACAQVVEHVCKLAKKGLTPSQIGVILRDSHGIAQASLARACVGHVEAVGARMLLAPEGRCRVSEGGAGRRTAPPPMVALVEASRVEASRPEPGSGTAAAARRPGCGQGANWEWARAALLVLRACLAAR